MYTPEEKKFIKYWEANRNKRKRLFKNLLISLPAGIIIVVAIFINFFSGWYKKATMVANADPSIFIILFICGLAIVAFWAVFTSYHKWDINETHYQELMSKNKRKLFS